MRKGATVKFIPPEIRGEVLKRDINPASDELELLVEYEANGETVRRWFKEEQLQLVEGGAQ
jgi:dihydroneopterin aldolase